jgi:hypothetical protein
MNTFRDIVVTVVVALVLASIPVHAEVSAETDVQGRYVRTVIFSNASVRNVKVWTVQRAKVGFSPLNPYGDDNGDLWPLIVDQTAGAFRPWVVWSRFNGTDYDLAWSTFEGSWRAPAWVQAGPAAGDDLDPSVSFDSDGRPYMAWWRNEGGRGRVYLSVFLVSRWMLAYPVSDEGIDSVHPQVTVRADGKIVVSYDTPAGKVTRVVVFSRPSTITDDVTPFGRMTVTEDSGSGNNLGK